jgi:hypothetical protein
VEGLKKTVYTFKFDGCSVNMLVRYDDRDGAVFVTEPQLETLKVLAGRARSYKLSTYAVTVGGEELHLVNGARQVGLVPGEMCNVIALNRGLPKTSVADILVGNR